MAEPGPSRGSGNRGRDSKRGEFRGRSRNQRYNSRGRGGGGHSENRNQHGDGGQTFENAEHDQLHSYGPGPLQAGNAARGGSRENLRRPRRARNHHNGNGGQYNGRSQFFVQENQPIGRSAEANSNNTDNNPGSSSDSSKPFIFPYEAQGASASGYNQNQKSGNQLHGNGSYWNSRQTGGRQHRNNRGNSYSSQRGMHGSDANEKDKNSVTSDNESASSHSSQRDLTQNRQGQEGPFGSQKLEDLLKEESTDKVLEYIQDSLSAWENIFNRRQNDVASDIFIIYILGQKICKDSKEGDERNSGIAVRIVSKTLTSSFSNRVQKICKELNPSVIPTLENLHIYLDFVLQISQNESINFLKPIFPIILNVIQEMVSKLSEKEEMSESEEVNPLLIQLTDWADKFIVLNEAVRCVLGDTVIASAAVIENERKPAEMKIQDQKIREKVSRFFFTAQEEEIIHRKEPPEDFRDIPIIPTLDEIMDPEDSFLRPNKVSGAYRNSDHYLDVQFRLFREDFLRPLKKGIQEFMAHKHDYLSKRKRMPFGTVRLYNKVRILKAELIREAMTYTMQLEDDLKRIKWDKSRRLLNGSLLLFTHSIDCFKTAYFGVVVNREPEELSKNGTFGITWEGNKPEFSQKNHDFLMFESECYFEAYRHTLRVLKEVPLDSFPMAKYIVGSSSRVRPPQYLREAQEMMNIGDRHISPLYGNWPSASELKLDITQYEAFRAAITNEFAIIQGPPGTGKTFLGLKVVEALLRNQDHWMKNNSGPILIVCLTNHALDQFLEGILNLLRELEPNTEDLGLIRVGGRCQSEILQEYSLGRKRMTAAKLLQYDVAYKREKGQAFRRVRELENERNDVMNEYISLANLEGVVDLTRLSVYDDLYDKFPFEHLFSFGPNYADLFGIGDDEKVFESNNFKELQLLSRMFRIREKIVELPKPKRRPAQDADEDYEDYDLDELQANRVLDDVFYEAESKEQKNLKQIHNSAIQYVPFCSISSLNNFIKEQNENIKFVESSPDMHRDDKEFQLRNLRKRILVGQNKIKFLKCFFQHMELIDLTGLVDEEMLKRTGLQRQSSPSHAWAVHFCLVDNARRIFETKLTNSETQLIEAQKELQRIYRKGDGNLLKCTKVVGMTTTGASKASDLLQMMKSKIVIVEEAAEVLEAHIINCLTQYCQHLIMIGDHQQLRPNISVLELASKYHLNISLFERMVNNKLNCYKLLVQHRMRPEISDLIRESIYDRLENHDSVKQFPEIRGMTKNLYFIKHHHLESSDSDSVTKTNTYEAKYLVALCNYLILQGYSTKEVTILATYTGQMFLLKKELNNFSRCKGVRVTAVDNFQGEENNIILLSLVRSNRDNNIGFLKTDNRICVALSRARHGLYIIGNMDSLVVSSPTWKVIQTKLKARNEIGENLTIACQGHFNTSTIKHFDDFKKYPEGGCSLICDKKMKCGHRCKSLCHQHSEDENKRSQCMSRCEKKCSNDHQCQNKCFMPCKPCPIQMEKVLPCSHIAQLKCCESITEYICKVNVVKKLMNCNHTQDLLCCISINTIKCQELVTKILLCGHESGVISCCTDIREIKCEKIVNKILPCGHLAKNVKCHQDMTLYTCMEMVSKELSCGHKQSCPCYQSPRTVKCSTVIVKSFSSCSHKIEIPCHEKDRSVCGSPCSRRLLCGHQCRKICHPHDDENHFLYKCKKPCARSCANGHPCMIQHQCHEPCPPCDVPTKKYFSCKTHTTEVKCNVDVKRLNCRSPCERHLQCSHKCGNLCFQPCGPCSVPVTKTAPCGHGQIVECPKPAIQAACNTMVKFYANSSCGHYSVVPCRLYATISRDDTKKYCQEPCKFKFDKDHGCGHACKGTCSECLQGLIHKKCSEECGRPLICGHICNFPCAEFCPPCQHQCGMRCDHTSCFAKCGEPCQDCCEPCTWKCEHKQCGKLCRDLCDREPCEEPCQNKLRCGHSCIGFCGEPCPPLCRVCDRPELIEFQLYGYEEDEDSRFVYLEDCKHCIEYHGLEYYMFHEIEKDAIVAKSCPKCKTLIRHSKRYGNILKKQMMDIMKVKQRLFGNQVDTKAKQLAVMTDVRKNELWEKYFPYLQQYVLHVLAQIVPSRKLFGITLSKAEYIPKNVDQHVLRSIEVIVNHGKDAIIVLAEGEKDLKVDFLALLKKDYTKLFERLCRRSLPLSRMEITDFDREFARLFDYKQLYKRRSSPNFGVNVRVNGIYETALKLIRAPKLYTMELKESLRSLLKEMDDLMKNRLGISDRERREILAAFDMKQGHWYKCPNGHIYVITECGGAMQVGKCNECGADIGGGNHRLRQDNALASEMDGAAAPSWPANLGYGY